MEPAAAPSWNRSRTRVWAVAVTVVAAVAVLIPLVRDPGNDSFPLSTYPMFTSTREPVATIDVVAGVSAAGTDERLSPELIAGTDEVIQAAALVGRAVRAGPAGTARLCRDVAARVAEGSAGGDLVDIEVRTDAYDTVAWFRGQREPLQSRMHAHCQVPR